VGSSGPGGAPTARSGLVGSLAAGVRLAEVALPGSLAHATVFRPSPPEPTPEHGFPESATSTSLTPAGSVAKGALARR